jgi:hypothetical protein
MATMPAEEQCNVVKSQMQLAEAEAATGKRYFLVTLTQCLLFEPMLSSPRCQLNGGRAGGPSRIGTGSIPTLLLPIPSTTRSWYAMVDLCLTVLTSVLRLTEPASSRPCRWRAAIMLCCRKLPGIHAFAMLLPCIALTYGLGRQKLRSWYGGGPAIARSMIGVPFVSGYLVMLWTMRRSLVTSRCCRMQQCIRYEVEVYPPLVAVWQR